MKQSKKKKGQAEAGVQTVETLPKQESKRESKQSLMVKGLYTHAQIHGYFTVKEYIMLEQEGKHCLLVRFQNEMKTTVHEIDLTVRQLNAAGKTIGRIKLHYAELSIAPGEKYCTERGIVLDPECVDCIVQIKYLIGDRVKYVFRRRMVTAHYDPRGYERSEPAHEQRSYVTITRKYRGGGRFFHWIAFLSFVLAFALLALLIYQSKQTYGRTGDLLAGLGQCLLRM